MQGMRIKSHKGYFNSNQNTRFQTFTPWSAKTRPAVVTPIVRTTSVVLVAKPAAKAKAAPKKRAATKAAATRSRKKSKS